LSIAFGVGALIGAVGIGGVLLIPALTTFAALPLRTAMATALFTFTFTGIVGTVMFQRRGSIDWRITRPVLISAVVFAFLGAWANSIVRPAALALVLAGVIIFAGVYTLLTWHGMRQTAFRDDAGSQRLLLSAIGGIAGFGSGLTGVGGPALSVPLMVMFLRWAKARRAVVTPEFRLLTEADIRPITDKRSQSSLSEQPDTSNGRRRRPGSIVPRSTRFCRPWSWRSGGRAAMTFVRSS